MVHLTIGKGDKGYNLVFTVTENDGTVKDLTGYTATFQVWRPSTPDTLLIDTAATSTAPGTGVCTYTLLPTDFTASNYYEGRLILTAAGIQESVESFLIAIPDSAYYCSVAEIKDELNITGSEHDYKIQALVQQVQKFIGKYCHRTFMVGSSGTVRYFDGSDSPIWIDDCTNIESIHLDQERDATYSSTMSATDYLLKPYNTNPKTYLVLSSNSNYGSFCSGTSKGVKITGTWGFDTAVPEDIRRAAIIQCCRWFKRADSAYASVMGPNELGGLSVMAGLDPDVKLILESYVRKSYAR